MKMTKHCNCQSSEQFTDISLMGLGRAENLILLNSLGLLN